MNRNIRLISGIGLLCAAAAASHPGHASLPPASAISSEDFIRLDLDGDGKLSRSERRSAPGLLLHLDLAPDPNDDRLSRRRSVPVKRSAATSGVAPLSRE